MTRTNRQKKLRKSNRENCGRKVPYMDKVAAWSAIHGMRRKGRGYLLRPYRCGGCGRWHVGNDWRPR